MRAARRNPGLPWTRPIFSITNQKLSKVSKLKIPGKRLYAAFHSPKTIQKPSFCTTVYNRIRSHPSAIFTFRRHRHQNVSKNLLKVAFWPLISAKTKRFGFCGWVYRFAFGLGFSEANRQGLRTNGCFFKTYLKPTCTAAITFVSVACPRGEVDLQSTVAEGWLKGLVLVLS